MILWKFTVREVKSRPGRATLTLLSIVIGVAAVVAVNIGTATTDRACQEMYVALAGRAALEVAAADGGGYDEAVVAEVEKVPGVKAAVPSVQKPCSLHYQGKKSGVLGMGIDPARDEAVRDYQLEEGRFFEETREALLETGFARALGVAVGGEVKLITPGGGIKPKTFRIVGLLSPRGAAGFSQGGVIFLPLETAQKLLLRHEGMIDTISIVPAEGADEKALAAAVKQRLPQGLDVRSPMVRSQLAKENFEKVQQGLNFSNFAMLALAGIMILNTFLMNVGERRRQFAVLRAVGATRGQVVRALLLEGLAMGCLGTALGSAGGVGGAYLLTRSMGQIYSTAMPALYIPPQAFLLAALIGPAVSLLAMFIPAWIGGKVSPLEGMRFVAAEGRSRLSVTYILLAIAVFIATGSVMVTCIAGYLPIHWMTIAGVIFTLAFVLLVPMVLGPAAWLVATVFSPLLRTEGRIAQRQVLRRRVRTTLTIGILYVAVSTAIALGTTIFNTVDDIHHWVATALKGDYFIRAMKQDLTSGLAGKMPESLIDDIRAVEGVSNVDSIRNVNAPVFGSNFEGGKTNVLVIVRDFTDHGNLPLMIKSGDPSQVRQRLADGEVVLGTVLANRIPVKAGEQITLETRQGPKQLRVAATTTAYWVGGMLIYMEGKTARQLLNVEGVDMYVVNIAPGASPEVLASAHEKLTALCDASGLMLHAPADLRQNVDRLTAGVIASLWGLLALGLIVGAFGIANTLTMNVLEQTRELALLRVVAMTRRQVRKTIFSQAVIIGLIGMVMGVSGGIVGAYVINLISIPLMGSAAEFVLRPGMMAMCFGCGLAVILAAAWLPAERAARLKLLIALQYE